VLPVGFTAPREADLRRQAWRCDDFRLPEGTLLARCELLDGAIVRVDEDTDGDGKVDHIVLYRDGLPATGKRDLDGDGVFETAELYAGGALRKIEVDVGGDGKPDYVRTYQGGGSEAWDLDADGVMDLERSQGVLRELRTAAGLPAGGRR
jgi:hypothetical protein